MNENAAPKLACERPPTLAEPQRVPSFFSGCKAAFGNPLRSA
ncbi:hypothetical protein [Pseudomonas sp. Q1-7]|nr:hypothetical protein [Pseudomonas sp. Q1-7]